MTAVGMPLRIAIFLHALEAGGAQRRALMLARHFRDRGHQVTLLLVAADGPLREAVPAGVALRVLGTAVAGWPHFGRLRRWRVRGAVARLARVLRDCRFDVLLAAANHVNLAACWAHWLAGSAAEGTALVLRISNHLTRDARQSAGGNAARRLMLGLATRSFARADDMIAVSRAVAEDARSALGALEQRVQLLPNPVYDRTILDLAQEPVDHPWMTTGAAPVILAVGRLAPQKDYPTLLRATARLNAQPPVRLIVLGDGPERARLHALAQELGIGDRVDLAGYVANPWAYMQRAAAVVLSSAWEGLPGALIEAMALGRPVAGTDGDGGTRELLNDGRLAPLVPAGDADALAQAIRQVLALPPESAALRASVRCYRADLAGDAYLELMAQRARARAAGRHKLDSNG